MMDGNTYCILPGFVHEDDPGLSRSINGWNDHLERWLLEIQDECNRHYVMLIETARALRIWKWVFIIINIALASSGLLATAIAVPLGQDGIWLPIYNAVAAVVGAALFTIYESMDFNGWGYECRNSAGEYIILGRNIESVKRVPRAERDRPGLLYANDASITFETIRANQPPILGFIRRRHPPTPEQQKRQRQAESMGMEIPMDYFSAAMQAEEEEEDDEELSSETSQGAPDSAEKGEAASSTTSVAAEVKIVPHQKKSSRPAVAPVALQDLFMARLETVKSRQDENDDLNNYENYIRSQYSALARDNIASPRANSSPSAASAAPKTSSSIGIGSKSGGESVGVWERQPSLRLSGGSRNNRGRYKKRR